ncbi:hypothetical protein KSS87_021946 [Heliosperma pusillum]|nr:hypothetical protein KSS87_021946 [Heliosperma pusillum]
MTKNNCEAHFITATFSILKDLCLCYLGLLFCDSHFRVIDTLKEYAIKALVNTVDHLGSVTYKVNDFLDEQVEEVSGTELRVSCIEQSKGWKKQRASHWRRWWGLRRLYCAGQSMNISNLASLNFKSRGIDEDDWLQFRTAVIPTIRDTSSSVRETPSTIKETPPLARRGRSISPSPRTSRLPGSFSFTGSTPKKDDIRSLSPRRFPLLRSGSLASRPATPKSSRPTTPNTALERQRYLPDAWKSVSMRIHHEKEKPKDIERQPSKSKRLLKALLSRRKSKKDDMLLTYLDEY